MVEDVCKAEYSCIEAILAQEWEAQRQLDPGFVYKMSAVVGGNVFVVGYVWVFTEKAEVWLMTKRWEGIGGHDPIKPSGSRSSNVTWTAVSERGSEDANYPWPMGEVASFNGDKGALAAFKEIYGQRLSDAGESAAVAYLHAGFGTSINVKSE